MNVSYYRYAEKGRSISFIFVWYQFRSEFVVAINRSEPHDR